MLCRYYTQSPNYAEWADLAVVSVCILGCVLCYGYVIQALVSAVSVSTLREYPVCSVGLVMQVNGLAGV